MIQELLLIIFVQHHVLNPHSQIRLSMNFVNMYVFKDIIKFLDRLISVDHVHLNVSIVIQTNVLLNVKEIGYLKINANVL